MSTPVITFVVTTAAISLWTGFLILWTLKLEHDRRRLLSREASLRSHKKEFNRKLRNSLALSAQALSYTRTAYHEIEEHSPVEFRERMVMELFDRAKKNLGGIRKILGE